jgi:hypothetical protein
MLAPLIGCSSPDERLIELGERANARQQAQNEVIAAKQKRFPSYHKASLTQKPRHIRNCSRCSSKSSTAMPQAQLDELHREARTAFEKRTETIDHQRDLLEQERQQIAAQRTRAPVGSANRTCEAPQGSRTAADLHEPRPECRGPVGRTSSGCHRLSFADGALTSFATFYTSAPVHRRFDIAL